MHACPALNAILAGEWGWGGTWKVSGLEIRNFQGLRAETCGGGGGCLGLNPDNRASADVLTVGPVS